MMNKTKRKMIMMLAAVTAVSAFAGCGTAKEDEVQTLESYAEDSEKPAAEGPSDPVAEAEDSKSANADADEAKDNGEKGDSIFASMDTTTLDGEKMDSSVFAKNKVTLVNLWNIGCTPCVEELPILDQLNKDLEGTGAAIMGLYFASPEYLEMERAEIEEILSKAGAEYPQLTLSEDMINSETIGAVQAFPTTYVVDSEGNIVNKIEGSNDYDGWKAFIEKELEKAEAK